MLNIDILEFYILMHADYQDISVCSTVAFTPETKHKYAPASFYFGIILHSVIIFKGYIEPVAHFVA